MTPPRFQFTMTSNVLACLLGIVLGLAAIAACQWWWAAAIVVPVALCTAIGAMWGHTGWEPSEILGQDRAQRRTVVISSWRQFWIFCGLAILCAYVPSLVWGPGLLFKPLGYVISPVLLLAILSNASVWLIGICAILSIAVLSAIFHRCPSAWPFILASIALFSLIQGFVCIWMIQAMQAFFGTFFGAPP